MRIINNACVEEEDTLARVWQAYWQYQSTAAFMRASLSVPPLCIRLTRENSPIILCSVQANEVSHLSECVDRKKSCFPIRTVHYCYINAVIQRVLEGGKRFRNRRVHFKHIFKTVQRS